MAVINTAGSLIERVDYDPFGQAFHHWALDIDGDGDVDATDDGLVDGAVGKNIYDSGYLPNADINRDGVINSTDAALIGPSRYAARLASGDLSGFGNTIGFSGYLYNQSLRIYCVRFRHYDVAFGRWLERDPMGYVDSMSLYGYCGGNPIGALDPYGLYIDAPHRTWFDNLIDFGAGIGDQTLFGFGEDIRGAFGLDGIVNPHSGAYVAGEAVGFGVSVFAGGVGVYRGLVEGAQLLYSGGSLLLVTGGTVTGAIDLALAAGSVITGVSIIQGQLYSLTIRHANGSWSVMYSTGGGSSLQSGSAGYGSKGLQPPTPPESPNVSPGPGWEKKGPNWYKPETGESLHPHLDHPPGIDPHWDWNYRGSGENGWRLFPDGSCQPKP